jgi:hypothetical protein
VIGVDRVGTFIADHLGCDEAEFWVDRASALVVRRQFNQDEMPLVSEVTELAFGPIPAERFAPPPGTVVDPRPTDNPNAPKTPPPGPAGS